MTRFITSDPRIAALLPRIESFLALEPLELPRKEYQLVAVGRERATEAYTLFGLLPSGGTHAAGLFVEPNIIEIYEEYLELGDQEIEALMLATTVFHELKHSKGEEHGRRFARETVRFAKKSFRESTLKGCRDVRRLLVEKEKEGSRGREPHVKFRFPAPFLRIGGRPYLNLEFWFPVGLACIVLIALAIIYLTGGFHR